MNPAGWLCLPTVQEVMMRILDILVCSMNDGHWSIVGYRGNILTRSLTHSLTHSPTHPLTHSLTRSLGVFRSPFSAPAGASRGAGAPVYSSAGVFVSSFPSERVKALKDHAKWMTSCIESFRETTLDNCGFCEGGSSVRCHKQHALAAVHLEMPLPFFSMS